MKKKHLTDLNTCLKYGVRSRCPQCGEGKLFASWNVLKSHCEVCGCPLQAREDETWFFMYMSTAFITGLFVIAMFFIFPMHASFSRYAIAILAILVFVVTTGPRKGIAIAIDYFIDKHSEFPRNLK